MIQELKNKYYIAAKEKTNIYLFIYIFFLIPQSLFTDKHVNKVSL